MLGKYLSNNTLLSKENVCKISLALEFAISTLLAFVEIAFGFLLIFQPNFVNSSANNFSTLGVGFLV